MKDPPAVGGRWAITLRSASGASTPAIGEFKQVGARIFGTILDPTGDHRFLEGDIQGRELSLSRFDGGSAYLYHATLNADGTLSGRWWSGAWSEDTFTARRDAAATLADPAAAAAAAAPPARLEFRFPDLDGRPVSLEDARFKGKVVIVALGGSWCPNCHDEAQFLQPLYRELGPQGLEIVYLQFEHYGDFAQAVAANRRFVAQFDIRWPVLIAGISEREDAARKLPALGGVFAFPTTVVLDREGRVRKVHSGFSGPATGQHYQDFRKEFTELVRGLLAEKG
jgi:peroxiredoxin